MAWRNSILWALHCLGIMEIGMIKKKTPNVLLITRQTQEK